ncbi:hypothetical protein, partial [Nocardia seriolae]|uniref:hypothetical protein n=1 Tax=Nocardia seriolae TaxID=37332 RepID=UPI001E478ED9
WGAATPSPASPSTTATASTADTEPCDAVFSTVSHYRIPTTRQLTPFEVRALLSRHASCTPGHGHTAHDCSARTQLLQIHEDHQLRSRP